MSKTLADRFMRGKQLHRQQGGMASIIIMMTFIIVISLLVISFAQLARRERRQTIDRQLSAQAYYAAESGINDAVAAVKALGPDAPITKTDCAPLKIEDGGPTQLTDVASKTLVTGAVEYSCLLIDPEPDGLLFGNIKQETPTIVPITPKANITKLRISWDSTTNASNTAVTNFLPKGSWSAIGILRADLMKTASATDLSRTSLRNNSRSYFLSNISSASSTANFDTSTVADNPQILNGTCSDGQPPYRCSLDITIGLNAATSPQAYLALRSIYEPLKVKIEAYNSSNALVKLIGAQYSIDSTGKAQDIVRRIMVRVPMVDQYDNVATALFSMDDLCKRFTSKPDGTTDDTDDDPCKSLPE